MVYKNNKRGFTLVELLAVIVILAVVILIAVTAVVPRMNNAKKKAFIDEALIYLKAGKEAYTAEDTECFNINEFDNYIKNNKDNYSGTLFVNEKGATLNLTDGKYYVITSGDLSDYDIKDTAPTNFITSCSDTSKTYTITYDLGGGTLSTANPSSYNPNTPTFTLNNPTKSGYRFVGWSSKNLLNMYGRTEDYFSDFTNTSVRQFDLSKYYVGMTPNNYSRNSNITSLSVSHVWTIETKAAGYGIGFPIRVKPNSSYMVVNPSNGDIAVGLYKENGEYISFTQATSADLSFSTPSNAAIADVVLRPYPVNTKFNYYDIQVEEGSTSTDYQEYMEPTTNAKVYRGSVGNKKFIANWEAI